MNNNRHIILKSISPVLNREFDLLKTSKIISKNTLNRHRSELLQGLKSWPKNESTHLDKLKSEGFSSLSDQNYWLDLEISAHLFMKHNISLAFNRSLDSCYQYLHKADYVKRPSNIIIMNRKISLLDVYLLSKNVGQDLQLGLECLINNKTRKPGANLHLAYSAIQCIKTILSADCSLASLEEAYRYMIEKENNIVNTISKKTYLRFELGLRRLLQDYKQKTYGLKKIKFGNNFLDVTEISNMSSVIYDQLNVVNNTKKYKGKFGSSPITLYRDTAKALTTLRYYCEYDNNFKKLFENHGLNALALDNFRAMKLIFEKFKNGGPVSVKRIYETFSGVWLDKSNCYSNILKFVHDDQKLCRTVDISSLGKICPKLLSEIKEIHQSEIDLIAHKANNMTTLQTKFRKLKDVFNKYLHLDDIKGLGVSFLSANQYIYQINLLARIQKDFKNKSISLKTGKTYISSIRWLCSITNQEFINAYAISGDRYDFHSKRLSNKDTYSINEVREIVFHIEKAIQQKNLPLHKLVAIYFVKIQVKTGWNTASLTYLECSDIIMADDLTKSKPVSVLLQKPRKGYKTDEFTFNRNTSNSAIHDLITVRDFLTNDIREKYKNDPLSNRIFIYEGAGELKVHANINIVENISNLLKSLGCTIKYNSMKLRKTVSNEVYRQMAKDISRYKDSLKHSYSVFLKNYQRIEEAATKENLTNGAKIMEDFFSGREVSSEINIVKNYYETTQLTPLGGCDSEITSSEAKSYRKANKYHSGSIERCGEFIACIWCKYYKVVADSDHVWKLLSFNKYALSQMKAVVADFPKSSIEKQACTALSNRVIDIIEALNEQNSKAVDQGKKFFEKKGMHPAWKYAIPQIEVNK